MEETGVVSRLDGAKAFVSVKRQSACDACAAGSVCKVSESGAEIEAFNAVHAEVGDTVKISFKAFTYLKGTILVYGVPAISLVIGAVLGKDVLSGFLPGSDPDILSAISGFSLMIVSFLCVKLLIRKFEKKKELVPVVEEIISKR
ncbi:MAG TPA: SoxR reducing system RseC family protein [Dissulfurispiraceae bacterium]|nr:SoxR reducing system RseC family protein [Dissulfurispiraceae bacterium]